MRRGGFATRAAAVAALDALLGPAPAAAPAMRTGEWLERWLTSRVSLRASTLRGYTAHIRGYLVPYLGAIPLAELSPADVQAMFAAIMRGEAVLGRPVSAATLRRIHATLRAALNTAVRAELISSNPGRWPELPAAARPRPQVWTPALTERWQQESWRPKIGVWTGEQTAQFLHYVRDNRLYALFHLVALRGLRRGEAAGLRWSDLDLDARTLTVTGQLQQLGGRLIAGPPKSDAGRRAIALDKTTIAALRVHRAGQQAGVAPGHAARAAARRRHPGPGRRRRHEDRPGPAWPLDHDPDRRHVHQRASGNGPRRRREHRSAALSYPRGQAALGGAGIPESGQAPRTGLGAAAPQAARPRGMIGRVGELLSRATWATTSTSSETRSKLRLRTLRGVLTLRGGQQARRPGVCPDSVDVFDPEGQPLVQGRVRAEEPLLWARS